MSYRYDHFRRKLLKADMGFLGGPEPGQPLPEFDLATVDHGRVTSDQFVGSRPLLLTFGSFT